eukprot:SAG22_NODE_5466_length_1008_cov_1.944994_1_plen_201_part_00
MNSALSLQHVHNYNSTILLSDLLQPSGLLALAGVGHGLRVHSRLAAGRGGDALPVPAVHNRSPGLSGPPPPPPPSPPDVGPSHQILCAGHRRVPGRGVRGRRFTNAGSAGAREYPEPWPALCAGSSCPVLPCSNWPAALCWPRAQGEYVAVTSGPTDAGWCGGYRLNHPDHSGWFSMHYIQKCTAEGDYHAPSPPAPPTH